MELFDVTVLLAPVKSADGVTTTEGEILLGPVVILARDENAASLLVGRKLTDDQVSSPSRVVVVTFSRSKDIG